jgi:histidyl-tRNA synthetase
MEPIRGVKGMHDVLPDEIGRFQRIERAFADVMRLHGFREIRTPYVEPTPLFVRTIGESTDVVEKEMYSFRHHEDDLTLRPEGTAGAARAYVEHKLWGREPVSRWYYLGPMFRAERPARGRYRQFHQAGCELFGDPGPGCDAEMIDMLVGFLREIGVTDAEVLLNSLGGREARTRYRDALRAFLLPHKDALSGESQRRLETNPLRILDSKSEEDQKIVATGPTILDFLSSEDRAHFDHMRRLLDALGTPYRIEPRLVRGLDYYTRTLFEIQGAKDKLGAQCALLGGGRYDGMIHELGGPPTPAIGFAAGIERLVIASDPKTEPRIVDVLVVPLGEAAQGPALELGRELRRERVSTEVDTRGGSLKSMLRRANDLGARIALILGESELSKGVVQLKDLLGRCQEEVPRPSVVGIVVDRMSTHAQGGAR